MAVKPYDASQVSVVFGGATLDGFAEGSFVTITPQNPDFTYQTNSDGGGTRSASSDRSATMTVTLAMTSETNDILSAFHNEDRNTPGGVLREFQVKDLLGNTICSAETAWITQFPDVEFAQESGSRAWEFGTDNMAWTVGGNPTT